MHHQHAAGVASALAILHSAQTLLSFAQQRRYVAVEQRLLQPLDAIDSPEVCTTASDCFCAAHRCSLRAVLAC